MLSKNQIESIIIYHFLKQGNCDLPEETRFAIKGASEEIAGKLTPAAPDASQFTATVCEHGYKYQCPHGCL